MKLNNFKSVYAEVHTLHGITIDPSNFEDIALTGWDLIGNKQTRLYKYTTSTINKRVKLPCNIDILEAVFSPEIESNSSTQLSSYPNLYNQYVEQWIEAWKRDKSVFYNKGRLVKYRLEGDELVFERDYPSLTILYHGIIMDEDGLPYLTDKEVHALATYCAYNDLYKKSLAQRDGNLFQLSQAIKADWIRQCNAARVPEHITQNEMNDILDVKTRFDRKVYNKSFKPIL